MRLKNVRMLLLAILLSFSNTLWSGILIEPYGGYTMGRVKAANTGSWLNAEYVYANVEYGGRVGYDLLGLMVGFQYSKGAFEWEWDNPPAGTAKTKQKYDMTNMGAFIGYNFPVLLRVWGTYFLSSTYKNKVSNDEYTGKGYSAGIGLVPIPTPMASLSINFEYRMINLDQVKDGTTGVKNSRDYDVTEYVVSVSLPIDLF